MINFLTRLTDWILKGGNITFNEAVRLSEINEQRDVVSFISFANLIREKFRGNKLNFYVNINVKTGEGGNDCDVCFHPASYDIDIKDSAKMKKEFISRKTEGALKSGADKFSVVVYGRNACPDVKLDAFNNIIKKTSSIDIELCASPGTLSGEMSPVFERFCIDYDSGKMESPESSSMDIERFVFFNERINVLKAARDNGYRVSSGVQFGTGESVKQRLIFAYVLKEFDLDSIALHFPVSKKNIEALHPMELLKIIAIYRFIHPNKEIILSGSHWKNFEIIKPLILLSGANAVMTGNFLTAAKKNALEDIKSLADFKQIH